MWGLWIAQNENIKYYISSIEDAWTPVCRQINQPTIHTDSRHTAYIRNGCERVCAASYPPFPMRYRVNIFVLSATDNRATPLLSHFFVQFSFYRKSDLILFLICCRRAQHDMILLSHIIPCRNVSNANLHVKQQIIFIFFHSKDDTKRTRILVFRQNLFECVLNIQIVYFQYVRLYGCVRACVCVWV